MLCTRSIINSLTIFLHHVTNPCIIKSAVAGYKFAGLQALGCYCDSSYGKHGVADDKECDYQCPGNNKEICGAHLRNSVFQAGEYPFPHFYQLHKSISASFFCWFNTLPDTTFITDCLMFLPFLSKPTNYM